MRRAILEALRPSTRGQAGSSSPTRAAFPPEAIADADARIVGDVVAQDGVRLHSPVSARRFGSRRERRAYRDGMDGRRRCVQPLRDR